MVTELTNFQLLLMNCAHLSSIMFNSFYSDIEPFRDLNKEINSSLNSIGPSKSTFLVQRKIHKCL
jgi:hypothetical protein